MKKLKLLLVLFALLVGTTASWAKTDVTATYLKDADLSSLQGWGDPGKTAWVTDGAVNVVEFWNWSNQFSFTQVAKLPAGYYRLAVNAFYRNSWGGDGTNNNMAWILAGSKTQNVIALNSMSDLAGYAGSNDLYHAATAFSQGKFSNEFDFNVTGEGTTEVEIGFKGTCPNGGWCILGPVTLYEYTAADYIDDYRAKVTEAEALYETPMYGDDLVALKAAIVEEETLTTVDDVTSAINTLSTAINDALNSISKYAVDKADFDAIKGAADAIIAVDYTETSSGSHSTFESAIATQNNAANGAANADAMKIAISNLKEAIKAYIAGAEPKNDGEFFDVTCLMVNPDFDNNNIDGWTKESTLNPNTRIQCNEFYGSAAFDFYQTITGLPNGSYTLSMRAFQRPGSYDGVYADYANGINNATAKIYVNSDESDVMNIMAEMNDTRIYTDPAGEDQFNSDKQPQNAPGFIPNSMEGAAAWFAAGKYLTEVAALVEDGTLRLGFKDGAHSGDVWTLFDEFRLHYYGSSKMIYYKQYLPQLIAEASNDLKNDYYVNVTGEERNAFTAALDATPTSETESAYQEIIDNIKEKQAAFREAKVSYDAYLAAKAVEYEDNLPYASSSKFAAIATAQEAAEATSASDAQAKIAAIISAYRLYVESNAMAEGVDDAEDKTSLIVDPNFVEVTIDEENQTAGGWKYDQIGENVNIFNSQPLTDGSGNTYSYFDYYDGSNNNQNIHQVIEDLEPGRYLLTAAGRGAANFNENLQLYVEGKGSEMIPAIGGENGTFGNGWNDVSLEFNVLETSDVTIGVKTDKDEAGWWSATRFRLVKLGNAQVTIDENIDYVVEAATCADVTLNRTIKAETWNTFVVPFDIDNTTLKEQFGEDAKVAEFFEIVNSWAREYSTVYFYEMPEGKDSIKANTPVLLWTTTGGNTYTFDGVTIETGDPISSYEFTNYEFVGSYAASITLKEGDYFIGNNLLWEAENGVTTVRGTRAYLRAKKNAEEVRITDFHIGEREATGIVSIDNGVKSIDNATFDLQGRKVTNVKKGLYIKNSKKVVVK